MAGININTGGGGIALGAGSTATGATIVVNSPGAHIGNQKVFEGGELASLLSTFAALRVALVTSSAAGDPALAKEVMAVEQAVVENKGQLDQDAARRLLARIRYAGAQQAPLANAVAAASNHVRKRNAPSDVFLSYKREQRERILPIVSALQQLKVDVWYDAELQPGRAFTEEICEEIDDCKAQIVCWSAEAARSPWVTGEAEIGRNRQVLVPVFIEECRLPPPFNMLHTENLQGWSGDATHVGWRSVLKQLGQRLGRPRLEEGA